MTMFNPEFESKSPFPLFFGLPATLYAGVASAQRMAAEVAAVNIELFENAVNLMLVPFAIGPRAVESAAPDTKTAEPAPFVAVPPEPAPVPVANAPAAIIDDVEGVAPVLLDRPAGVADDLLLIRGIGPKLNQLLNSLGVWHYRQIVGWTPAEVAWVNAKIDFRGRIQREGWQAQAAELLGTAKAA